MLYVIAILIFALIVLFLAFSNQVIGDLNRISVRLDAIETQTRRIDQH